MIVSNLAGDSIRHEVSVESANWMSALRAGRAELGETGGVPTGSSCAVSPEGTVTILDPMARRRFVLAVETSQSFTPSKPGRGPSIPPDTAPRAPASKPAQSPSAATASDAATVQGAPPERKKKPPRKTMAYLPQGQVAPQGLIAEISAEPSPPPPKAPAEAFAPSKPVETKPSTTADGASSPEAAPAARAAANGAAQVDATPPAPDARAPSQEAPSSTGPAEEADRSGETGNDPQTGTPWKLHLQRDEEPSESNPLVYRERTYVVPEGTHPAVAERIARERLQALQSDLADRPKGRFVNFAVFDHPWTVRPERPPLITLQYKDWQGNPLTVDRPLERLQTAAKLSASQPPPPMSAPPGRKRSTTDDHDARLAMAFEACQDLLFLSTPLEGLEFALHLFEDLVPSQAALAGLYDIDSDVFRVAAAEGPGSDAVRGTAIPFKQGLFAAAGERAGSALRIPSVTEDSRFDPEVDARDGLTVRDALYLPLGHSGRTLGVIQLLNGSRASGFTDADADLAAYVGQQLSRFLYQARLKGVG